MDRFWTRVAVALPMALALVVPTRADWPRTLLANGDFSHGIVGWTFTGDAGLEREESAALAVVRNGGSARQYIGLPADAAGKWVVFVGRGASERVEPDGVITGLPSLYGMFVSREPGRFTGYAQGQDMLARPAAPNEWVRMSGMFRVPPSTAGLNVRLSQASRAGVPQNGSAARFDDVGVYLFDSEKHARSFVRITGSDDGARWPSEDVSAVAESNAAFIPGTGIVLAEDQVFDLLPQCSRHTPQPIENTWAVDVATTAAVDAALAPVLQRALEGTGLNASAADYSRQFIGLVVNGRRIVYVNGFATATRRNSTVPLTTPVAGCDGGPSFFGAEFDIERRELLSLRFNGAKGGRGWPS